MPGMTDRDHFAAAALTGLLASDQYDRLVTAADYAETAFELADAMLRERCREGGDCPGQDNAANLDAVPAVKAGTPGTGDTPKPINDCVSDRSKPITGPDPDSRVWETHTPATHATHGEGSVRREGTEPEAWGVEQPNGEFAVIAFSRQRAEDYATASDRVVPLYRHPPCQDVSQKNLTLTDAEAETLRELRDEAAQYADEIGLCASEVRGRQRIIDGLLERLGGGE